MSILTSPPVAGYWKLRQAVARGLPMIIGSHRKLDVSDVVKVPNDGVILRVMREVEQDEGRAYWRSLGRKNPTAPYYYEVEEDQ